MSVRAKMVLTSIKRTSYSKNQMIFGFSCQYDSSTPEDQRFQKYTPSGTAEFYVENPVVEEQFKLGEAYYIDFSPVPKE